MADPIYYLMGADTDAARAEAETRLRSMGCMSAIHEPRGDGAICSLGYAKEVPGAIPLRIDTRTPVEAV